MGKESVYRSTIGIHNKHEEANGNWRILAEFVTDKQQRIIITYFERRNVHETTWISSD